MPRPVRILYTIPNFITAGSGLAMLHVARRLDRNLFEPAICVSKKGGKLEEEIARLGIPLFEAPFTTQARPWAAFPWRAWREARKHRSGGFDLWHSYHYLDDYTEPVIARLSGARAWVFTKKNMSWNRAWKLRSRLASGIACQNTTMLREFYPAEAPSRKARLIPPGADTGYYRPDAPPSLGLRQKLAIPGGALLLNCVAQLVPVKGHPVLLKALARLPGIHLAVAGNRLDAAYADELERLAADLGIRERVHFLGGVADIPALHAECDGFVLPTLRKSRMEGCPIALLEAMACEKPAIATRIPGCDDVIQDGANGWLTQPEDEADLARAIGELAASEERRRTIAAAGRKTVLTGYTIEREVAQLQELYLDALGR